MTRHDLDLTQPAFEKRRGDLMLYGAWHGKNLRPCLVVLPAFQMVKPVPLVIELDQAWKWNPDDPDVDPRSNARMIGAFLQENCMDYLNTFTAMKVASLIHDHLGDLLAIPPKNAETVVVADAIHTDHDTGRVHHREIIQRV